MSSTPTRRAALCAALWLTPFAAALAGTVITQQMPGYVTSLSTDGKAAAGTTDGDFQTFRWTARGGVTLLGRGTWIPLNERSGTPRITGDGQTIGATFLSDDGQRSTMGRWTLAGGWQQIVPPLPADAGMFSAEDSSVYGMSRDGSVISGLYWRAGQSGGSAHAARWTAATGLVSLGSDGGNSRADGVSADGSVLVGWDEHPSGSRRATVWANGVKTILDASDWNSEASVVNAAGTIVVGYSADETNNFRTSATMWSWNGAQWVRKVLGAIDGKRSQGAAFASGVSDDGSVVTGVARPDANKPTSVGFVWTAANGMQDVGDYLTAAGARLNPLFKLVNVTAISADGRALAVTGLRTGAYEIRSFIFRQSTGTAAE